MVGMKKLIVWVFFASLVAFGCYPFAEAQETPAAAAQPSVPSGTYQPFSVWQQVRFGATSVVNPEAAKAAVVVHAYGWDAIAGDKKAEEAILSKAKAGQVSFANEAGDGASSKLYQAQKLNGHYVRKKQQLEGA
jgi:hypothetical protein